MKNLTKTQMNRQQGFTLIELVVVIVILGILAVTAAPKFIDLTSDARVSVMKGVKGSIESAVSLVHSKALIEGQTGGTGEVEIGGTYYTLVNGYPANAQIASADGTKGKGYGIVSLIDIDTTDTTGDFVVAQGTSSAGALFQHNGAVKKEECQLSYANAEDKNSRPKITETLTDC